MPTNTQLERKILSKNEGFVIILVKLFFFHICYHSWKPITEVTYFGATGIFRSTHHELMWRKKCGIIGESFFLNVHFLRKNLQCSKPKQYLSYRQNVSVSDNYSVNLANSNLKYDLRKWLKFEFRYDSLHLGHCI